MHNINRLYDTAHLPCKEGDYIVDQCLVKHVHQEGGMGLVYHVFHQQWDIDMAAKSPRPHVFETPAERAAFIKECETWVQLGLHPYIVYCYFLRFIADIPYIFSEYITGGSLSEWITSQRLYRGDYQTVLKRMIDIGIQTCRGLEYAHSQGIVHRDVKPRNILLTEKGTAKVTDFGLAKALKTVYPPPKSKQHSSPYMTIGGMTPAYCSPEQFNGDDVTAKTDTWSWAVTLLEMFNGGVSWEIGPDVTRLLRNLIDGNVIYDSIPNIPERLTRLLERCFNKAPCQRPDISQVGSELSAIYRDIFSHESPYISPDIAKVQANGLNNQAVVYLELGQDDKAVEHLNEAIELRHTHPEAVFNISLIQWRKGLITDSAFLSRYSVCEADSENSREDVHELKAQIHMERFAPDEAEKELEAFPGKFETLFKDQSVPLIGLRTTIPGGTSHLPTVGLSRDGRIALTSKSYDKEAHVWNLDTMTRINVLNCRNRIRALSLSHDGKRAVVALEKNENSDNERQRRNRLTYLQYWDVNKQDPEWEIQLEGNPLLSGFSMKYLSNATELDSNISIDAQGDHCLLIFGDWPQYIDLKTGKVHHKTGGFGCLGRQSTALSADGQIGLIIPGVSFGNAHHTITVVDPNSWKTLKTLKGHTGIVKTAAITADGRFAVSGSEDYSVRLWDTFTGDCLTILRGHKGPVDNVAISDDGLKVISFAGFPDHTLRLWDTETGQCIKTLAHENGYVELLLMNADGTISLDNLLDIRQLSTGHKYRAPLRICRPRLMDNLLEEQQELNRLHHSLIKNDNPNDIKTLFNRFKKLWKESGYVCDSVTQRLYDRFLKLGNKSGILHISEARRIKSNPGPIIRKYVGDTQNAVANAFDNSINEVMQRNAFVYHVDISSRGILGLSAEYATIRLLDLNEGSTRIVFEGHQGVVSTTAFSPNAVLAISAGEDKLLRFWDTASGTCLAQKEGHTQSITCACFSLDGSLVFTAGQDKQVMIWDTQTFQCCGLLMGHSKGISCLAATSDNRLAISAGYGKTIRVWEISSGKCLHTLEGHDGAVNALSVLPGDKRLLSASNDSTIRLWDIREATQIRILEGHAGSVTSLALCGDRYAFSSGNYRDAAIRLWDLKTGRCVYVFDKDNDNTINSISSNSSGDWILSGGDDQYVKLWRIVWDLGNFSGL